MWCKIVVVDVYSLFGNVVFSNRAERDDVKDFFLLRVFFPTRLRLYMPLSPAANGDHLGKNVG